MKPSEEPVTISFGAFESIVKRYEGHVPKDLFGLEEIRLKEVPETLAQRKREGRAFLEKTEVTALTEWKLKHGTYRPNLAKLVASNTVKDIRAATETSFSTYESNTSDPLKAFAPLTKLKGIGPATASLLLSCYDPSNLPFFSDELYRYTHWEEAKNKGWDRKIGYTMKEYKELFKRVHEMKTRLESESKTSVNAVDIEKAAYVLGKEAQRYPSFLKRKDDEENDTALQPPPPKKRKKRTPSPIPLGIQRVSECRRKGLRGSPTYDELGFELDKEYIIKHTGGRPRPLGKRAQERLNQSMEDDKKKREIMGIEDNKDDEAAKHKEAWDDRVARDLGIHFHEVGMEEYEEWQRRGFKADPQDFRNLSQEEKDRLMGLMSGSALRKGSKHR